MRLRTTIGKVEAYDGRIRMNLDALGDQAHPDTAPRWTSTCCSSPPDVGRTPTPWTWTGAGVEVDAVGLVVVDEYQRTTADGLGARRE